MNRKEFIDTAGRYGLLAIIALLVAFLFSRRNATGEEVCTNDYRCGGCNKRDNCRIEKK